MSGRSPVDNAKPAMAGIREVGMGGPCLGLKSRLSTIKGMRIAMITAVIDVMYPFHSSGLRNALNSFWANRKNVKTDMDSHAATNFGS